MVSGLVFIMLSGENPPFSKVQEDILISWCPVLELSEPFEFQ